MAAIDAGYKHRVWSVEGEYYWRSLDNLSTVGDIPEDELFDHGFQLQVGSMLLPRTLQACAAGSKISGGHGDPWDLALGLNWYPNQRRLFRVSTKMLYLNDSPVDYSSVTFALVVNGVVFHANLELMF